MIFSITSKSHPSEFIKKGTFRILDSTEIYTWYVTKDKNYSPDFQMKEYCGERYGYLYKFHDDKTKKYNYILFLYSDIDDLYTDDKDYEIKRISHKDICLDSTKPGLYCCCFDE